MRIQLVAIVVMIGCQTAPQDDLAPAQQAALAADPLKEIFDEVDGARLTQRMRELSGDVPVTIGGTETRIDERFSADGRKRFRLYFTQVMTELGLEVTPLHYQAAGHPRPGDNVEAVLRGPLADSMIVIVHYDSIGPRGRETSNPGADDDMTGMAILFETARLFVEHRAQLTYTVRFVASDEEELGGLAGARNYAAYIKARSQAEGFDLVVAVDDEQSGWNCSVDNRCGDNTFPAFDIFSCGSGAGRKFDFAELGDQFAAVVAAYSPLHVTRGCLGQNSDHFAMWEIGVPAVVYSEHNPFANPHFDRSGGDTFDKIDMAYLTSIARPAIAFQAGLAGLLPRPPTDAQPVEPGSAPIVAP
ncbi:MAG TPA: M20/M25/M40 family metallo-hydrolase [Kofleriaceae bacterium]|nr:M20/M25/M40 family metallo-hydrolase [Kofleriaceae bacterium]